MRDAATRREPAPSAHEGGAVAPFAPPVRALVTAGPTEEPIDEVRFIGNRSSGRLGIAIADALAAQGAEVVLALGPVQSAVPVSWAGGAGRVTVVRFRRAADLAAILRNELPSSHLVVMAAAVADFRPKTRADGKLRRGGPMTLELEPVEDLLSTTAEFRRPEARVVGFALEPAERLERSAREKLARKSLDAIVANPLETMNAPDIDGTLYLRDGGARRAAPEGQRVPKEAFARWLAGELLGHAP
jgi:phosphopantothenoylcysteine decarboxylase / phosphopantothenate---cysteine ligase